MTMNNSDPRLIEVLDKVQAMARAIARRTPSGIEVDDLVSAGYLGVATALARHDGGPSGALIGYCLVNARGAMYDELRRRDMLSRDDRKNARTAAAAIRRLQHRLGREPDEREVAGELKVDLESYRRLRAQMEYRTVPTESTGADATFRTVPLVDPQDSAEQAMQKQQRTAVVKQFLHEAKRNLRPNLATTVTLSLEEQHPVATIGKTLGISQGRVSQLRKAALRSLQQMAAANDAFRQEAVG
jgi:RNA polymerase sigma factor for flagellar operon FliA